MAGAALQKAFRTCPGPLVTMEGNARSGGAVREASSRGLFR